MVRAAKRANDAAVDPYRQASDEREFFFMLQHFHDAGGLWRKCRTKRCKRARSCRGDTDDCGRNFPRVTAWLQETLKRECAGLSFEEAELAAAQALFGVVVK